MTPTSAPHEQGHTMTFDDLQDLFDALFLAAGAAGAIWAIRWDWKRRAKARGKKD